jgi:hypothetical protein
MHPEDRLDALLTARRRDDGEGRRGSAALDAAGDDALAPLLESAYRLEPLRAAQPDRRFAQALEARLVARATERRRARPVTVPLARTAQRELLGLRLRLPVIGRSALRPALVAAVAVLALGLGTLTVAAAAAGPGSPLFGLHRLEQNVQVNVAGDSAARARGHLQLARQWLGAVQSAATQRLGDPTYSDALQALRDEAAAAASEIAQVPPGAARTSLEADLAALQADEMTTLQAALAPIGWQDRVATTDALGALGAAVPRVSGATLTASYYHWQVTLTGSGFAPGAVLLVNGRPAGTVTATSAGRLTAELRRDEHEQVPTSLGVGNPDGTAAVTSNIQVPRSIRPEGTPESCGGSGGTATPGTGGGTATPGTGGGTATPGTGGGTATPGRCPGE